MSTGMDRIVLQGLEVQAVIGIWEWERRVTQLVRIDLEIATDVRRAAAADDIGQVLNYKDVAKRIAGFVSESQFQLVETLAESIAGLVLREFSAPWIRVSVTKPGAIEGSRSVGVIIERAADDATR